MKKDVLIKLFRFDAKSDYLSYYKPYQVKVNYGDTIDSILKEIEKNDPLFFYSKQKVYGVKIAGFIVEPNHTIDNFLSDEIIIEPLSTKRATLDLQIDDSDFWDAYRLFEDYTDEEDKHFYRNYLFHYYASPVKEFNKEFIGESAIVLANKLIEKNASKKLEILNIINDIDSGLWYYGGLINALETDVLHIDKIVRKLKDKITKYNLCDWLKTRRITQEKLDEIYNEMLLAQDKISACDLNFNTLNGKRISVYLGNMNSLDLICEFKTFVEKNGGVFVATGRECSYSALEVSDINDQLFANACGKIIEDSYDSACNVLVSFSSEFVKLGNGRSKEIKCYVGRELPLEIIYIDDFLQELKANLTKSA